MSGKQLVVGAIIVGQGQVLAARRVGPEALAGMWEFPGGKVEPGESPRDALRREIFEELGVRIQVDAEFESASGPWPIDDLMEMRVYFATVMTGEPTAGADHDMLTWSEPADLVALLWTPADEPIAHALAGL